MGSVKRKFADFHTTYIKNCHLNCLNIFADSNLLGYDAVCIDILSLYFMDCSYLENGGASYLLNVDTYIQFYMAP
jgi:hypothetical protein